MRKLFRCYFTIALLQATSIPAMSEARCAAEYNAFQSALLNNQVQTAADKLVACIEKYRTPAILGGFMKEESCPTKFRMPERPRTPVTAPWWQVVPTDQLNLQALCSPSASNWLGLDTNSSPILIGKNAHNDFVTIFLNPEQLELFRRNTEATPMNTEGLATIVQGTPGASGLTLPQGFEPYVVVNPENSK